MAMTPITEPGIYIGGSSDDYFADPCPEPSLNQSLIKIGDEAAPLHMAHAHVRLNPYGQRDDSSRAQWFGSAVHRLALGAGRDVRVLRYPDYKHSTARAARDEAIRRGEIPILEREHDRAFEMAERCRELVAEIADGAEVFTEVPVYWREQTRFGWIWARAMLDVWIPSRSRIVDLKTTRNRATSEGASSDITSNRYDIQDDWYRRGVSKAAPEHAGRVRFEFLLVEGDEPHGHALHYLDEESRYLASRVCDRQAESFAQGMQGNTWPGYPRQPQRTQTAGWYQSRLTNRELSEG
jgi:hypothetical protein